MASQRTVPTITAALALALLLGGRSIAASSPKLDAPPKTDAEAQNQPIEEAAETAECRNVPDSPGLMPAWYAERCVKASKSTTPSTLAPTATRGPILLQEVATNTVDTSSVAGIATLSSFGALVPTSATDFPADFVRLPTDPQRVYQITSAGAVSRYSTGGANTVLAPIAPAAGSTWSDAATDPTTGIVYGSAIVGSCASATLSTLNLTAGTSVPIGPITGGGCIIALAADNAGNLFGIDIVADTLVAINKTTGAGTVVGPIGFNANFGQGMDCDPASGTCYMFTINVTAGNTADLRSVNTSTGATALVGLIGSTAPGGAVQVAGAVFETITDSCTVDGDCQDGNLCNGVETCVGTVCTPGTPVNCDDGLFCTTDVCTPGTGACSHPLNLCSDGDSCTVDGCDEATDTCTHTSPAPVHLCNTGAITIPLVGAATPYPSTITASGLGTTASLCSVQLLGISHTFPSDIDMLLVGPGTAQNAIIMSDAGGTTAAVNVNLTLKDSAALSIPTPLASGTFKPTNVGTGDTFPAPAPAPTGGSALSAFNGTNPNGDWKLFVVDDVGGDQGSVAGGWCVDIVISGCTINADCNDGNLCNGAETCVAGVCTPGTSVNCDDGQFCTIDSCDPPTGTCLHAANPCSDGAACTLDSCDEANDLCAHTNTCVQVCNTGAITINDSTTPPTTATPYPSVINISGVSGIFSLVSVDLNGIAHTFPDDIDILLVAPNTPDTATIMSDVGGSTAATGINLSLTDGAPAIPDAGPLVSGTFAPTNVNPGTGTEAWPAPAPASSGASALAQFNGTNPNGDWKLFVVDDQSIDSGSIAGGWCMNYRVTCNTAADCDDGDSCTADNCASGACIHTNACDDGNPCTVDTCSPGPVCGHTPIAVSEVNNSLRVARTGGNTAVVSWTDPPGPFNVYRGTRHGTWQYNHGCWDSHTSGPSTDPDPVPTGWMFYYLVSRSSSCGESIVGRDGAGVPDPNPNSCEVTTCQGFTVSVTGTGSGSDLSGTFTPCPAADQCSGFARSDAESNARISAWMNAGPKCSPQLGCSGATPFCSGDAGHPASQYAYTCTNDVNGTQHCTAEASDNAWPCGCSVTP